MVAGGLTEGQWDVKEGLHDISHGNIWEGIHDIIEGVHDTLHHHPMA